jgi:hypothetical protein
VLIDRNDLPKHLFGIPDLGLSDDLCAERLAGPWFRLGWRVQHGFRQGQARCRVCFMVDRACPACKKKGHWGVGWQERDRFRQAAEKAYTKSISRIDELAASFSEIEGTAKSSEVFDGRRFNVRNQLWGHVFGGRYKAVLVESREFGSGDLSNLIDYVPAGADGTICDLRTTLGPKMPIWLQI